ncbi:MAG: hypothetical protein U0228_27880 [Myxococcaceae bacterium]
MQPRVTDRPSLFFGVVLAINVALILVYQFVTFRYEVHSDSAVKVLLAEEIVRSGQLFPHDWVYANGDVYAFFSHTLAIPLIPLFGAGFTTHALVGLTISLALLWVTWRLLAELNFARWKRLAVLALIGSGISSLLAENLFGQATYGFIIMLHGGVLALALAFIRRFDERVASRRLLIVLAGVSVLLTWNNPKRALVMLTVPFLTTCLSAGVVTLAAAGDWSLARVRRLPWAWLGLAQVLAFAVGWALAHVFAQQVTTIDPAAVTMWLPPDGIWRNSVLSGLGLLAQLGGVPAANGPVVSMWGVYETVRLVLGVALLWGVIKAVRELVGSPQTPAGFVALFTALSAALSLLFFVFTTLPDMSSPLASARYMVPSLFLGLVLVPQVLGDTPGAGGRASAIFAGAVAAVAVCGFTTLALPGYGSTGSKWEEAMNRGATRVRLVEFLEQHHLQYGYATYWNANALTMLSEGRVRVRQVTSDAMPSPTRIHGSRQWFRAEEWTGPTFLLYTQQELKRVDRPLLEARMGSAAEVLSFDEFRVLVFPKNLATLPGWSDRAAPVQQFQVNPATPHRIGRYQAVDAVFGSLVSARAEAGELLFGPFLWLPRGHYRVSFDLAGEGEGGLATLEVAARQGALKLVKDTFTAQPRGPKSYEFEITEEEEKWVEFRALATGAGVVTVWGTTLEKLP